MDIGPNKARCVWPAFSITLERNAMAYKISRTDVALLAVALEGDKEKVATLLDEKANVNVENHEGWTPLICAAISGKPETILLLLNAGASINAQAHDGSTALMKACLWGHRQAVATLLIHGADVAIGDDEGWTALKIAVEKGHRNIAQLLKAAEAKTKETLPLETSEPFPDFQSDSQN